MECCAAHDKEFLKTDNTNYPGQVHRVSGQINWHLAPEILQEAPVPPRGL